MVQSVKYLPYKHKYFSAHTLVHERKKLGMVLYSYFSTRKEEASGPMGFTASQHNLLGDCQASEKLVPQRSDSA